MNNKTFLLSIIFILILIGITAIMISKVEVDDEIKYSTKGVNLEKGL